MIPAPVKSKKKSQVSWDASFAQPKYLICDRVFAINAGIYLESTYCLDCFNPWHAQHTAADPKMSYTERHPELRIQIAMKKMTRSRKWWFLTEATHF